MGQWDSDYIGGGGGKVSETRNKERGARVLRIQRRVGGIKGLNLQRRGWGQGVSTTEKGSGVRELRLKRSRGTKGLRLDRGGEGDKEGGSVYRGGGECGLV